MENKRNVWLEQLRENESINGWNIDSYLLSGTFCEFYKASKGGEDVVIKLVSFFNLSVRY